jgi:sec-independent protein translocase protein TatC
MFDFGLAGMRGDGEKEPMNTMGFLDHLEELRKRLVNSIVAVLVGMGICWWKVEKIYDFMQRPIMQVLAAHHLPDKLVYLNPTEPFSLYMKIAAMSGLFLTSPYVMYQVWLFIAPGLYRNEKRYVFPFMFSTISLFVLGGYFGYRIAYPRALDVLIGFGKQFQPMITIGEYTQLFLTVILGMGLIFEMPVIVFFLAFLGVLSPRFMLQHFRYAILTIFIIAAIVAPPDIVSMCVFAAPMVILYAVSVGVAWLVHPERRKARLEKKEGKKAKQAQ